RGQDFLVGCLGFAQRDVVAQLSEEQLSVLHRKANPRPQVRWIVLPRIDTIDEDAALLCLVEAEQKPPYGRLAGSNASDDADLLAAFDLEGYLVEGLAGRIGVGEADVIESDRAFPDLSRDIGTRRGSLAL